MTGLRVIEPYYYDCVVHCKQRWFGRTLFEVITEEFKSQSRADHEDAIAAGRAFVVRQKGEKVVESDYRIKSGDTLHYRVHWHEPPVSGAQIEIIEHDDERGLLVVNKPGGIPVHPSGKYRYNSLTEIMEKEYGIKVYASHRLDRLTSGLMLLCTTSEAASMFSQKLRDRTVKKTYLARVVGKFPDGAECSRELYDLNSKLPHSAILQCVQNAKPAKTAFKLASYNDTDNTSIIWCYPETGRMHQIRKHLAILGNPIVNDELYNNTEFKAFDNLVASERDSASAYAKFQAATIEKRDGKTTGTYCEECNAALFKDPESISLDLHAFSYEAIDGSWKFQAPDAPFLPPDFRF